MVEVRLVYHSDLQFAPIRGLHALCDLDYGIRVEIEPYDDIVRFRFPWFLLDAKDLTGLIESRYAITLRIVYLISEYHRLSLVLYFGPGFHQLLLQARTIKDIVAQYQANVIARNEPFPDYEGLCKAIGRRLLGIADRDPQLTAVPEEPFEIREILGGVEIIRTSLIPASIRTDSG